MQAVDCPLCREAAAPAPTPVLWRDDSCRVVSAADADYPAFLRVIWQAHVREMTDLDPASQQHLLRVVLAVERVLRTVLSPDKINLATLGNQVPHLHWHVIPRFADDAHFPDPVWAERRRAGVAHTVDERRLTSALSSALDG
ncbi:MAG: HIT family protein [Gammaproteobacteria bacterium]|nr:HIT family protein [Gammaproteobacteria bacterium]